MSISQSTEDEGFVNRHTAGSTGGERPRLLFLCQTLPYPPDGGVHIRSFNIMKLLAEQFDVTALCFYRQATRSTEQAVNAGVEGLRAVAETEVFPIPQEHSRARLLWDHARSVLTRRAYTVFAYESRDFRHRIEELLSEREFDLVHLDSMDLSGYLPLFDALPVACTHHNVESDLLRRRAESESTFWRRKYLELQADLLEKEERRWCAEVDLNVAVSEPDAAQLSGRGDDVEVTVVPNGVDTDAFVPSDRKVEPGIVFVGGYTWYPNHDGMAYFSREILPLIRERAGEVPVTWVGRAPEDVRRRYKEEYGIHLTGYVEDIRPHVYRAACYVVPLRVGGGSRLKILDAWALGKAVVSTAVGCEGLNARDGDNILVRDAPEAFADAVVSVLKDPGFRHSLEDSARHTVEEEYDWRIIGKTIVSSYQDLVGVETADLDS